MDCMDRLCSFCRSGGGHTLVERVRGLWVCAGSRSHSRSSCAEMADCLLPLIASRVSGFITNTRSPAGLFTWR
eukprot:3728219-Prymnesium_polylepis.1